MRSPATSRTVPGEALMVVVAVLWGSAFPLTRVLLEEMPPLGAAAWRTLLAASAVALFAALRGEFGRLWPARGYRLRLAVLAVLGGATFLIGMNLAVFLTGASITSFVVGTYPLLAVVVAAVLLREPLGRRGVAAMGVAAVGLVLLARPGGANVDLLGVGLAFGAALSFAVYLGLARLWADPLRLPTVTVAFYLLCSSLVVTGAMQAVVEPAGLGLSLSAGGWAALLWLALPASALPHVLTIATLRRMPASRAAPFLLLIPISGSLIAAALLGERLDPVQLGGAGLILLGIGVATVRRRGVVASEGTKL
ncbi:MAG: DMT family transporter [Chloroflexota bacterium]|nr:DMT family transporter [Chloroflexota bacterium]